MRGSGRPSRADGHRRGDRVSALATYRERCAADLPDPDRAFLELWEHFGQPDAWRCFPDVAFAVDQLQAAGLVLRVGSNFDGQLRKVLQGLPEVSGLADSVVISSEVGYRKPHPSFYHSACDLMKLPPDRVLSVGDDPENDDAGARRAGLCSALVDRSGRVESRPGVFRDLKSLAALWAVESRSVG